MENQEVNEYMKEIANTSDENVLKENYKKLYDFQTTYLPYISLARNTNSIVYSAGLIGDIVGNGYNMFYNIEKWYRQ